ncbi:unnamed protein product [Rhizophagus irregularis]|nr:hypothetical protein RhiirC2_868939 [Rhizophagus irregularis]CAB4380362.1 unnamed protein product [Rhizophagus irregularis]CAB5365625.1 unnamed protein product [Rhizophagus irregularis]
MELSEAYYNKNEGFGPIYIKLAEAIYKSSLQRGVDLKFTDQLESVLRSRQTIMNVDIDEKVVIIGPNGGKVGTIFMDLYIQFCSTDSAVEGLCPYLNMSKDEYKEFIFKDYRNEICQSKNTKLYMVRYWAQKVNNN